MKLREVDLYANLAYLPEAQKRAIGWPFFAWSEALTWWCRNRAVEAPFTKLVTTIAAGDAERPEPTSVRVTDGICEATSVMRLASLADCARDRSWVQAWLEEVVPRVAKAVAWSEANVLQQGIADAARREPLCREAVTGMRRENSAGVWDLMVEADVGWTQLVVRYEHPAGVHLQVLRRVEGPWLWDYEWGKPKAALNRDGYRIRWNGNGPEQVFTWSQASGVTMVEG